MKTPTGLAAALACMLGLLTGACSNSSNDEELARLRAENEALRARAEREAEAATSAAAEVELAKNDLTKGLDDWAWADAPAEQASPEVKEVPRPVESAPRPITPTPKPKPRPEPEPEPEPEPINILTKPEPPAAEPREDPIATRSEVASGTPLRMTLDAALHSGTSQVGDSFTASLAEDVLGDEGRVVLPAGTLIRGTVTDVKAAKKLKRKSALAFHFTEAVLPDGRRVAVSAGRRIEGEGYTKRDGAVIGGSAAGGALLGQILGGDSEATAAGAVIGGAIGSGLRLGKKGEDIVLPEGTELEVDLEQTITVDPIQRLPSR